MTRSTRRPALNALAVLLLTGCGSGPGLPSTPVEPGASATSSPVASTVATPSHTIPPPSAQLPTTEPTDATPGSPSWFKLGRVTSPEPEKHSDLAGFVGFDDGYVVFGNSDAGPWLSFSGDGIEWTSRYIAGKPCASPAIPRVSVGASNGHEVLILGGAGSTDPCESEDVRFAAWRTSDGEHWTAAEAEGVAGITRFDPDALWWTPSGWHSDLGESPDGRTWAPIELPEVPMSENGPYGFAAPDGTVLLVTYAEPTRLYIGGDGRRWRDMSFPAGCEGTELIAPPGAAGRNAWVFFSVDDATTCVSVDLQTWSRGDVEVPVGCGVRKWADTRFGIIATVDVFAAGESCDPQRQYVSRNGLEWVPVAPDSEVRFLIADGPAGVTAIGGFTDDAAHTVWRLED